MVIYNRRMRRCASKISIAKTWLHHRSPGPFPWRLSELRICSPCLEESTHLDICTRKEAASSAWWNGLFASSSSIKAASTISRAARLLHHKEPFLSTDTTESYEQQKKQHQAMFSLLRSFTSVRDTEHGISQLRVKMRERNGCGT